MTDHFDESIITGTRVISGSPAIIRSKVCMDCSPSSMASSMLTSMTWAPFITCWRATVTAAGKSPSRTNLAKRADPATLVRSPMLTKPTESLNSNASRPLRRQVAGRSDRGRGGMPSTAWPMARM